MKVSVRAAVSTAVTEADTKFTPLLLSNATPLMGVTSSLYLEVNFCVLRLKPVNWIVAPSIESIKDPISPPARPVQGEIQSFWILTRSLELLNIARILVRGQHF